MAPLRDPLDLITYYKNYPWQQDAIRLWWEFTDPEVRDEVLRLYRNTDGIPVPAPEPEGWHPDRVPSTPPRRLTRADYQRVAAQIGLWPATLKAFADVESNGGGFNTDGTLKMLFEGQWFWWHLQQAGIPPRPLQSRYPTIVYPGWRKDVYLGGIREYQRLRVAIGIHTESALKSASWGVFQLMGFHHQLVGFKTCEDMLVEFQEGEGSHLETIGKFMVSKGIVRALQAGNWNQAVRLYNGEGQVAVYAPRLQARFNHWFNQWGKD